MKVNIYNRTSTNKRIRITPATVDSTAGVLHTNNPATLHDQNGDLITCLAPYNQIICTGATADAAIHILADDMYDLEDDGIAVSSNNTLAELLIALSQNGVIGQLMYLPPPGQCYNFPIQDITDLPAMISGIVLYALVGRSMVELPPDGLTYPLNVFNFYEISVDGIVQGTKQLQIQGDLYTVSESAQLDMLPDTFGYTLGIDGAWRWYNNTNEEHIVRICSKSPTRNTLGEESFDPPSLPQGNDPSSGSDLVPGVVFDITPVDTEVNVLYHTTPEGFETLIFKLAALA